MKSAQFRSRLTRQYQDTKNTANDIFIEINPNRGVDLTELFDDLASMHAKRRYKLQKGPFQPF